MNKSQYDPKRHHRRSIRLQGYDYSQAGLYFITICIQERACILGEITNGEMNLNDLGSIVLEEWSALTGAYPNVETDAFVVMPNHVHGIVCISENSVGAVPVGMNHVVGNHVGAIHESPLHDSQPYDGPKRDSQHTGAIGDLPIPYRDQRRKMLLFKIVGRFKMLAAKKINIACKSEGNRVWQRGYHEHIIRDEPSYFRISHYIENNPSKWDEDRFNPKNGNPYGRFT